jgi:CheY-specific phosphatase CheX
MIEHKPLYQAMQQAVSQTLENMAFMEVMEHFDPDYEIPAEQLAWTSLLISDPVQGEVRLAMTKTLLTKLTASIFALELEEISQAQMDDILHELLNTIAGLFMTNLLADNQTFQLGLPEAGEGELPELEESGIAWKLMTADEDPLQLFAVGVPLVALNEPAE